MKTPTAKSPSASLGSNRPPSPSRLPSWDTPEPEYPGQHLTARQTAQLEAQPPTPGSLTASLHHLLDIQGQSLFLLRAALDGIHGPVPQTKENSPDRPSGLGPLLDQAIRQGAEIQELTERVSGAI